MGETRVYRQGERPAHLQTESGWRGIGWRLRGKDVHPAARYKSDYNAFHYPLYHYEHVEPIPGKKALERRLDFMLAYLQGVVKRQAEEWVNGHALGGLITDEQIQDAAILCPNQSFEMIFFADQIEAIPRSILSDRLRLAYELGALAALDRSYADYAYNEW